MPRPKKKRLHRMGRFRPGRSYHHPTCAGCHERIYNVMGAVKDGWSTWHPKCHERHHGVPQPLPRSDGQS